MPKSWFAIKNATAETAEISIYDVIGLWGISARSFIAQLKAITAKKIDLRIHSPGGDVFEGNAIFNALKRHPATITSHIDGLAASMASVVALAGKTVKIAGNGLIMIHNPSTIAAGGAEEMRKSAELLDKVKDTILNTYEEKTGLGREEIAKMMDEETWMTAQESKDFGFVDEITAENKVAATATHFDLTAFRNTPAALRVDNAVPDDMKILTASLATLLAACSGLTVTDASTEAEVKAALDGVAGKISALEKDKKDLTAELGSEKQKVTDLTGEKKQLGEKVTMLEGEKKQLGDKVAALEGDKKTVDDRAKELAAAHNSGAGAGKKGKEEAEAAGGQPDGKTHYDAYQAAMNSNDGRKASEIWAAHEKAITAYVATLDAKAPR
jgi:ATP-dependent Clp endopeptidase proteolytic subunit ClpP